MSLVIALLIAAVGVLWYSLNTAETFANRSRTDIALGKYEILRDRSASPEKFLEAAKAKDYDIIIFSKEQTLALGEKIKELFPDGNADSRRFTIGIEDVMPNDLAKLFNDEMFSNLEISGSYCGVIIDFDSVPGASVTVSPCAPSYSGSIIVEQAAKKFSDELLSQILHNRNFNNEQKSEKPCRIGSIVFRIFLFSFLSASVRSPFKRLHGSFRLFFGFFTHALKRTDIPHHIQQERKAHHRRADDYQRVRQRRSNIIEHNMCNHQRV